MSDRDRHWQVLVDEFRSSGLSQAEFCRRQGINQGTFSWWKRELPRRAGQRPLGRSAEPRAEFAEFRSRRGQLAKLGTVALGSPCQGPTYELVLANGRSIRVSAEFDPAVLSRLVAAAESC
jgi:transposase-like protein